MISKIKTPHLLGIFLALLFLFVISNVTALKQSSHLEAKLPSENKELVEIAKNIKDECVKDAKSFGNKETCYSKKFNLLAEKSGPELSFQVMGELQKIDPDAVGCHLIAHGIGLGSYKWNPNEWRKLIREMNPSCNYGAIHGVLENYINSLPQKSFSKEIIPTICGENPRADCNHIIGHMILVETDGDVKEGLSLCEVLTDPIQLNHCYSGVFMEEETALNLITHGIVDKSWLNWPARLPELDKLCRTFSGEKFKACWTELVHVIVVAYGNDPKSVFNYCSRAPSNDAAQSCKYHGIGIMAAGTNFDLPKIKSWCDFKQLDNPNFKSNCYVQLVASTISTIPKEQDKIKQFCQSLESAYQPSCFDQISGYNNYTKNTFSND